MNNSKYYYDADAPSKVVKFIEKVCTHTKGELAGTPFKLENWQIEDIINPIYGNKRTKDNTRRYREAYIEIARKNGKTTLIAALALYHLMSKKEQGGEIYSAAADRNQASIIFSIAKQMVINSPFLSSKCKVYRNSIINNDTGTFFQAISADADNKHGFNASFIICDELHVWKSSELFDVLATSTGARREPLLISITTAGYDKNSFCYQKNDYCKRLEEGVIEDESFYYKIYAASPNDNPFSKQTWLKANPNLDKSISSEYLKKESIKAKNLPTYFNTFLQLHLNIWTNASDGFISTDRWVASCVEPFDESDLVGRECYGGLDLGYNDDFSALVLVFPPERTEEGEVVGSDDIKVVTRFFVPESTVNHRSQFNNIPYLQWVQDGYIIATEGEVRDDDVVINTIFELAEKFNIQSIAFDRFRADTVVKSASNEGIEMFAFGQGFISMNTPTQELEKLVIKKRLNHNNNPVLKWMNSNVEISKDAANNIKMNKGKAKDKIDGMVALVMALGLYINTIGDDNEDYNFYEDGLTFI